MSFNDERDEEECFCDGCDEPADTYEFDRYKAVRLVGLALIAFLACVVFSALSGCAALKGQSHLDEPGGVSFNQYRVYNPAGGPTNLANLDNRTDHEIEADVECSLYDYRALRVPPHTRQGFVFLDDQRCRLWYWRVVK